MCTLEKLASSLTRAILARAMKLFASLDTPISPNPATGLVGRHVANAAFQDALWRYADFDAYHYFPGDAQEARTFRGAHSSRWESLGIEERIQLHSRLSLPEALAETPYHIIHQSDPVTYYSALCALRNQCAGRFIPVSAPIHSISYPNYQKVYFELMLDGPMECDAIICTSRVGMDALKAGFSLVGKAAALRPLQLKPSMRLEHIPLGVDVDAFTDRTSEAIAAARACLGWKPDDRILLCFGRFSAADKYDIVPLLRAFQLVLRGGEIGAGMTEQHAHAHLVLAGARQGDEYPEWLQALAKAMGLGGRVHIYTDVSEELRRTLYTAADVFVSPSENLQETFGLTILEAMASGLPVVASNWDGYRELVEDGRTGVLVTSRYGPWDETLGRIGPICYQRPWHLAVSQGIVIDVVELAKGLSALIADPALCRTMGAAGRRRVRRYDWKGVIGSYLELWKELNKISEHMIRPPSKRWTFAHPPSSLFPGYASHGIPRSARLELSDWGQDMLMNPNRKRWYADIDALMDPDVIRHLCSQARRNMGVGEALMEIMDSRNISEESLWYQLAWCLKQDLIRLADEGGDICSSDAKEGSGT